MAGIGYTELSNGFASCDDSAGLQAICDRLGPGNIEVFFQRWLARLPLPLGRGGPGRRVLVGAVHASDRGVRTIVFDAPRRARAFFEALVVDNLDIDRPEEVQLIFTGKYLRPGGARRSTPSTRPRSSPATPT
jgi:hypothetical protein